MVMFLRLAGCVLFSVAILLVLYMSVCDPHEIPDRTLERIFVAMPVSGIGALLCWILSAMLGE